jgi:hypothetical protein
LINLIWRGMSENEKIKRDSSIDTLTISVGYKKGKKINVLAMLKNDVT